MLVLRIIAGFFIAEVAACAIGGLFALGELNRQNAKSAFIATVLILNFLAAFVGTVCLLIAIAQFAIYGVFDWDLAHAR